MKINDLVGEFKIYLNNEEAKVLDKLSGVHNILEFSDRDQIILQSLVNKSLLSKIHSKGQIFVCKNEN